MSTEDISEVPVSNEGVVFMQATSETKDGRADHVQSPARSLVPPIAFPRQFSPSPDLTPTPARTAWPVAQNQRPPLPPSGPGGATVGMSPSAFESWAVSVEDYGNICGWMPPLAASYVRLLCSGEVQQRIDARVNRHEFRLLSTTPAVDTVRSVVIGPRCVVGAWSDFFTYLQAPSDTICAYVSKCRAMAGECKFQCPKCRCSLDEYMLGKKVVMGLIITDHKALTRIFGDKELKDINNPRILNLKERTLMYSFRIKYPAETLMPTPSPQYPFQQVVADLFQLNGQNYIAYADRLTGWLEVEHLPGDTTSARLIVVFRRWFRRFGIPEELSCDGGTNLISQESKEFFRCMVCAAKNFVGSLSPVQRTCRSGCQIR
nr:uncharacterized protein LOC113819307 [Penaeus vannamei]